tara:strand:+ start:77 stop:1150 length:1074 start_codon:yes stop_codon:yes gene_type:complete
MNNNKAKSLCNSTNFGDVDTALQNLKHNQTYSIADIVLTIRQIHNFQQKTLDSIAVSAQYDNSNQNLIPLNDLKVDMTYQRRLKLKKLLKKLKDKGCFDKDVAGFVDVAQRTNGEKVVWDGFRRVVMAALTGLEQIPCSVTYHTSNINLIDQPKKEAQLFKIRNTPEKISPEENFKAEVVYEEPEAIRIKTLLENCNLDIEGIIGRGVPLGGIAEVQSNFEGWQKNPDTFKWKQDHWVTASLILQALYKHQNNVSAYLLRDLAWLLTVNEEIDSGYDKDDIMIKWKDWMNKSGREKQSDITTAGSKKKTITSWWISRNILNDDNGLSDKLYEYLPDIIKDSNTVQIIGEALEGDSDE